MKVRLSKIRFCFVSKVKRLAFLWLFLAGLCCTSSCNRTSEGNQQGELSDSVAVNPPISPDYSIASGDTSTDSGSIQNNFSDCVRGFPVPTIDKVLHPDATFSINKDSTAAIETVVFRTEDKLTIKHWGCEYFLLTYLFETSRFQGSSSDTNYWYEKAANLLEEASEAMLRQQSSSDILMNSITALRQHSSDTNTPAFGEEIDFGHDAIRNFVVLNRVQKLKNKRFLVEVTTAVGPL
ncbi:hypothetical protein [Pontibacter sp. SGAir0037]|uniref:hypothetical protein n=1 Tax=Pontibacter sp. SGAir0037 TaxID=2571030 RepID=UPI0010CCE74D|nr:hypothetical protein [Pontibacter sp. SGAir0037]QCR21188.1 hypothetical protein C1N53_01685 [Pontibacter sp. SGAir0037]